MYIQKKNKNIIRVYLLILGSLLFSGCAKTQYIDNPNLKSAIVILIKKVEKLEAIQAELVEKSKSTEATYTNSTAYIE